MKKLLGVVLSLCLAFGVGTAFADQDSDSAISAGGFSIKAKTFDIGGMADYKSIPNGGAFGLAGGIGHGDSKASGFVFNGMVEGEVAANSGGLAGTDAYKWHNPVPTADKSIGVGSQSSAQANTGASASIKVDPDGKLICGFIPTAGGAAEASIHGFAAQGTLNGSGLTGSPKYPWTTKGFTGGIAGQGSIGGFSGSAGAISGPDYTEFVGIGWRKWKGSKKNGHWEYHLKGPNFKPANPSRWERLGPQFAKVDSKAGAGIGAGIDMVGWSGSESYRYIDSENGTKTEGMGTFVNAGTVITSYGYDYDWDKGLSGSGANVQGGYIAAGGAATLTVQYNDTGMAKASALGFYAGAGALGSNFTGTAVGGSHTSITTVNGMNGSMSSASADMSVTATNSSVQPD